MKKILLSIAAASALAAAALPAAAQSYDRGDRYYGGSPRGGYDVDDRGERLEMRIRRAVQTRQISPREADRLRADVHNVERLAWRYRRDGAFTRWERSDIDQRFDRISQRLRYERVERDYGYGPNPYRR